MAVMRGALQDSFDFDWFRTTIPQTLAGRDLSVVFTIGQVAEGRASAPTPTGCVCGCNALVDVYWNAPGRCNCEQTGWKQFKWIKFSTTFTFTFKWKLKKHLLHEKNSQFWTLATFHVSRTKYCVF